MKGSLNPLQKSVYERVPILAEITREEMSVAIRGISIALVYP